MQHHQKRLVRRLAGAFAAAALIASAGFYSRSSYAQPAPAGAAPAYPGASTESLVALKMKFEGAQTCSNNKCHGAAEPAKKGPPFNNEFTLWSAGKDPHQKGFEQMTGKKGVEIFAKYQKLNAAAAGAKLADSQRCLTCHALKVPKELQGKAYTVDEGVGCNSCHGPSEKWNPLHDKKDGGKLWGPAQVDKAGGDATKVLAQYGFYYTKPLRARAEKCASCHLAIDAQMVEAGHPQTTFDMAYFSLTYPDKHWEDPKGYWEVTEWAVGQGVALREAGTQLASRAAAAGTSPEALKTAANLALAHFTTYSTLISTKAVASPDMAAAGGMLTAAGNDKAKLAAAGAAVAKAAAASLPAAEKFTATKATTVALLNAVAASGDSAAKLGNEGVEQNRNAIYVLYDAISGSPDKPADSDAVFDLITKNLFPEKPDAAGYPAALAAVKAKLPK